MILNPLLWLVAIVVSAWLYHRGRKRLSAAVLLGSVTVVVGYIAVILFVPQVTAVLGRDRCFTWEYAMDGGNGILVYETSVGRGEPCPADYPLTGDELFEPGSPLREKMFPPRP